MTENDFLMLKGLLMGMIRTICENNILLCEVKYQLTHERDERISQTEEGRRVLANLEQALQNDTNNKMNEILEYAKLFAVEELETKKKNLL